MLSENNTSNNNRNLPEKKIIKDIKSCKDIFKKQNNKYSLLSKKDTMYLSSLNSNDFPIRKFKQICSTRDWSLNLYNLDIEGSSPKKFGILNKKIDFTNNNRDIEKSFPKKLFKKIVPNYSLSKEGIPGSSPHHLKAKITRCINPLNPTYNLPKTETKDIAKENNDNINNKFIYDSLNINDIEGTRPKKHGSIFLRNNLNKDDIEGSFPRKRYIRKTKYNNIDYSDVHKIKHKRKLELNPLNPVYNWNYSINKIDYNVGPIEKNNPNPFYSFKYKFPFNISNEDIEGSKANSKNKFRLFKGSNSCLNIGDINGTKQGSLLKGIKTKRCLNPLTPNYRYLGEEELKSQENIILKNNTLDNNKITKVSSLNINKSDNLPNITTNNEIIKNKNRRNQISIFTSEKTPTYKNQNRTDIGDKIKQMLSELKENPSDSNKINFDKNIYKKPEIYFPLKHDKNINFIKNEESNKNNLIRNPNLRSFQNIIDTKINMLGKSGNNMDFKEPNKPFESKMDDFLVNASMNFKNSQLRLKENINAYYDIGFPDELKDKQILNDFI